MEVAETPVVDDYEPAFDELRRRVSACDDLGAIEVATSIAAQAREPRVVGRALMIKLGCVINLGRLDECPALLDQAFEILDGTEEYALLGGVHAVASFVASQTSMERCIRHMVQGWRALEQVERPGMESVDAFFNLAVSLSYTGFHTQAMAVGENGYWVGQELGLPTHEYAMLEASVRRGVALDHRGDTEGCVRMLREVLDIWAQRTDPDNLWRGERCYYGYASVRLAVLGEDVRIDPHVFSAEAGGWELAGLRVLADACTALVEQRPQEALALLDGQSVHPYTLGAAEIPRLRSLAHSASGDHRAALAAGRESMRLANEVIDDVRDWLIDGRRSQLDDEDLGRTVDQYAAEALTDPLTGVPNRRHFDRWITQAGQRGPTAVGVIDVDNFKAVNTFHGHAGGDLVLQRVAAILVRAVRAGDFVARYGGDEFVVVLPQTDPITAEEVGSRLVRAVAAEDWQALVADTPVSITVGWAEVSGSGNVTAALVNADQAMLAQKTCTSRRDSTSLLR